MAYVAFVSCPDKENWQSALQRHCSAAENLFYGVPDGPQDYEEPIHAKSGKVDQGQLEEMVQPLMKAWEDGVLKFAAKVPDTADSMKLILVKGSEAKRCKKERAEVWDLCTRVQMIMAAKKAATKIMIRYVDFADLEKACFEPDNTPDKKADDAWNDGGVCAWKFTFDKATKYMVYKPEMDTRVPGETRTMFVSCPFQDDGVNGGQQGKILAHCQKDPTVLYTVVDETISATAQTDENSFRSAWIAMVLSNIRNFPPSVKVLKLILVKGGGPGCAYERKHVLHLCEALNKDLAKRSHTATIMVKYVKYYNLEKLGFDVDLVTPENANDTWDKFAKENFSCVNVANCQRGYVTYTPKAV